MTKQETIQVINALAKINNKEKRESLLEDLLNYCEPEEIALIELAVNAKRFLTLKFQ